jgi:hypothetical protein
MDRLPPSILDLIAALPTECQADAYWVAQWIAAWCYCEDRGYCDGIGGHEHRRLTALARVVGLAPQQAAMRVWIRMTANLPPNPNPNPNPNNV